MPTTLQVTKKLSGTPLFDILVAAFANSYSNGLWWSLFSGYKDVKPLPERYLVDNLKRDERASRLRDVKGTPRYRSV